VFDGIDGEKAESMAALSAGADVAVVVTPHSGDFAKDARVAAGLLRAAAAAGVAHVVLVASWTVKYPKTMPQLSSRFAPSEALLDELCAAGNGALSVTVLCGGYFLQNFLMAAGAVKAGGKVALPFPVDYAFAPVDVTDIGRAAAGVAAAPDRRARHGDKRYECSGPARITGGDLAAALSAATGDAIVYAPVPSVDVFVSFLPEAARGYMHEYFTAMLQDGNDSVPFSAAIAELTGAPPPRCSSFQANAAAFKK
jgi:uncharacterized protein YbjT (DUF2867 family)